jgi:cytochrome P450
MTEAAVGTVPPGPRAPGWMLGLALLWRPEQVLGWCARRYGPTFTIRLGRKLGTIVYLTDPADIRELFRGDQDTFRAGQANGTILAPLLGNSSVLVTDGEVHKRQRKLMNPAFHGKSVDRLAPMMADIAAREIETWPVGVKVATRPLFQRITLEVILRTVIGADDETSLAELRESLPPLVDLGLLAMVPFAFPRLAGIWPWSRFKPVAARADAVLYAEIHRCRTGADRAARSDVLATLVSATDDDGDRLSEAELRDQLVTLLLAGHETTATGLAWAVERMVRHPDVLAKATAAACDGDDAYLDAVVAETLRVRPVVPDISRMVTRPALLGRWWLRPGVVANPAIVLVHKGEGNYEEPGRFDPERFVGKPADPAIWLPFGGGSRRCLGAAFAATEMRVVLRELLRRVDLEATDEPDERVRIRHVTLIPRHGAQARIALSIRP